MCINIYIYDMIWLRYDGCWCVYVVMYHSSVDLAPMIIHCGTPDQASQFYRDARSRSEISCHPQHIGDRVMYQRLVKSPCSVESSLQPLQKTHGRVSMLVEGMVNSSKHQSHVFNQQKHGLSTKEWELLQDETLRRSNFNGNFPPKKKLSSLKHGLRRQNNSFWLCVTGFRFFRGFDQQTHSSLTFKITDIIGFHNHPVVNRICQTCSNKSNLLFTLW